MVTHTKDTADLEKELKAVQENLQELRRNLVDLARATKDDGRRRAHEAAGHIRDIAQEKYNQAVDGLKQAREYGQHVTETAQEKVRSRPLTSVLVALAVGALVGRLMAWRHNR